MPELPEVETVRRMLEAHVVGRTVRAVSLSGLALREPVSRGLARGLKGRAIRGVSRRGKFLMFELEGDLVLLSHLGMSGRWLFFQPAGESLPHVHARIGFADGSELWFQDPRRFGLLRLVRAERLARDRAIAALGPDPIASPPTGEALGERARGLKVSVKNFLLDQKKISGIGNIYASEILHRARVDPRRRAGSIGGPEWEAIASGIRTVLAEAIARSGTTFSMYRTLWNEPGAYGEQLRVYDRARAPCPRCGTPIRRIVQGQRATFFCPSCQSRRAFGRGS
ncbi:MAG TPA: bifunctional DNA-formamidopyrimidine glycosylase/DNA-(apurinic or apyrimidinic site) lyase [Candidatus Eisenbacteria bacterium]|jgi:formamidopyrimidine-DNA glycosylase